VTEKRARGARVPAIAAGSRPAAAVMILACLLTACGAPSRAPGPYSTGGAPADSAANVEFADLDRVHAVLAGFRDRPVFVNFWATWCVPCVDELPDLAALSREQAVKEAGFIGVSLDAWVTGNGRETESKVRRALAQAGVGYPNLIYRGDQDPLLEGFQLPGPIPYSVLYDGRGKRAAYWVGPATIEEVRRAIAAATVKDRTSADAQPQGRPGGRPTTAQPAAPASPPARRRPPAASGAAGSSHAGP
jgi:thiol-disulfide isomerase/thioredoxin